MSCLDGFAVIMMKITTDLFPVRYTNKWGNIRGFGLRAFNRRSYHMALLKVRSVVIFSCLALISSLAVSLRGEELAQKASIASIRVLPMKLNLYVGKTWQFLATAVDSEGNAIENITFTWSSSKTSLVTIDANGVSHAIKAGTVQIKAGAQGKTGTAALTVKNGGQGLTNLFFLHHSTGDGFVTQGNMRGYIKRYNSSHSTVFEFWDHGYNGDGLRDPAGKFPGICYNIPDDNTDPGGLWKLWRGKDSVSVKSRTIILNNHEVIAFKSCFPNSAIPDQATLNQYKRWYTDMRKFFDTRKDRVFMVMSTPPLHRLATNPTEATNARAFANWLKSDAYLKGHVNIVCFNVFDLLAAPDDGSATANMLRYDYEGDHNSDDSHPNATANRKVGPLLSQALIDAAAAYFGMDQ